MNDRDNAKTDSGITRRGFVQAGAMSAAGAAGAMTMTRTLSGAPAIATKQRPNLLFLNVDQMSCEAMSSHGCEHVRTPHMDRLASRGVDFNLSYSADPVCCPARSSWVTGRPTCETGVVMNSVPMVEDMPDIGQWLRKDGYETVHVGKWHVSGRRVDDSFMVPHGGFSVGEHGDAATARACEGYLRNRSGGDPFFLMAGLLNPHDICYWVMLHNRVEEPRYPEIEGELPPLPPNFRAEFAEPQIVARKGDLWGGARWSDELWRHYIWAYYRHVEMVDGWIGRILDALEASGEADNTIVVVSADHGDGAGRHRRTSKGFLYDEAARVPMIVSCPGRLREAVSDKEHLVSGLDVVPTLCDFAGVAPPPKTRGQSLRPLLEGRTVQWRDFVEAQSRVEGRMIRTADYKYIHFKDDPVEQLFDMKNDPWETKNIATEGRHANALEEHRKILREWSATLEPSPASQSGHATVLKTVRDFKNRQNEKKRAQSQRR